MNLKSKTNIQVYSYFIKNNSTRSPIKAKENIIFNKHYLITYKIFLKRNNKKIRE